MTDKEFEEEIDKMYEELDQKQAEMEELGLINYGDSGYYWRNPEKYKKDKKICELESEIERLRIKLQEYISCAVQDYADGTKEILQLKQQLAEKDKEINKLKGLVKTIDSYNQYSDKAENFIILDPKNCYLDGHKIIIKTDKIDYAVERLKEVKKFCAKVWGVDKAEEVIEEFVDNQIKQLKERKKMKVIKKPKYKNVTCYHCLAVLKPQPKDLLRISEGYCTTCPLCRRNVVFALADLIETEIK